MNCIIMILNNNERQRESSNELLMQVLAYIMVHSHSYTYQHCKLYVGTVNVCTYKLSINNGTVNYNHELCYVLKNKYSFKSQLKTEHLQ